MTSFRRIRETFCLHVYSKCISSHSSQWVECEGFCSTAALKLFIEVSSATSSPHSLAWRWFHAWSSCVILSSCGVIRLERLSLWSAASSKFLSHSSRPTSESESICVFHVSSTEMIDDTFPRSDSPVFDDHMPPFRWLITSTSFHCSSLHASLKNDWRICHCRLITAETVVCWSM